MKRQLEQTKEEAAAALAACKKKGKGDVAAAESRGKRAYCLFRRFVQPFFIFLVFDAGPEKEEAYG